MGRVQERPVKKFGQAISSNAHLEGENELCLHNTKTFIERLDTFSIVKVEAKPHAAITTTLVQR